MDPQQSADPYAKYGGSVVSTPPPGALSSSASSQANAADPYAKYGGRTAAGAGPTSLASAAGVPQKPQPILTDNPGGEGLYKMSGPDGSTIQVPYTKVPIAAQANYNFADGQEHARYQKDRAVMPWDVPTLLQGLNDNPLSSETMGGTRGVAKTVDGLRHIIGMGSSNPDDPLNELAKMKPSKEAGTTAKINNAGGEAEENLGEFFSGEELMGMLGKGVAALPLAERLKNATQVAQILKAHPMIGALAKVGLTALRQAGVGGAQTYVKTGGDAGAAATTAAVTGGTGAVLGAAGEGISSAIASRAPTIENVGGVPTTVTREAQNLKPTPQQVQGQQAIRGTAQNAAGAHLAEVNESRAVPTNAPALPASNGPYEFNLRGVTPVEGQTGTLLHPAAKFEPTASRVPEGGEPGAQNAEQMGSQAATIPNRLQQRTQAFTTAAADGGEARVDRVNEAAGGTLKTQNANIARAHVQNLNDVVDSPAFQRMEPAQQQDILSAREEAMQQLAEYHDQVVSQLPGYQRPNFQPVDIPRVVSRVGSWSDAAAAVKKTAKDGYKQITDALTFIDPDQSPQELEMVRNAYQAAEDKFMAADTPEGLRAAEGEVEVAKQKLRTLLSKVPNAANLKEFSGMNDAYRNALGLQKISKAIDGSFHGSTSTAQRAFEYQGFDGKQLQSNMDKLIRTMGRNRVERLMGRANLDTVLQVAQLNTTNAARAKFGLAVKPVVQSLLSMHVGPLAAGAFAGHMVGVPYDVGAGAGWTAAYATRKVMDAVLTNPKVAQNLIFAIHSGANPENYGPMLATMIQQHETEAARQRQAEAQQSSTGEGSTQ